MLNKFASWISKRRKSSFDEFPSWAISVQGVIAFLVAGYLGLLLGDVVPEFVKKVNELGISTAALRPGILLGIYSLALWFFGCIAARCHGILYERWFK